MLEIQQIKANTLDENCYILSDETKEAVIVDCGTFSEKDEQKITDYVRTKELRIVHHICTHMHYDHCAGANFIWKTFNKAPEYNKADETIYHGLGMNFFGFSEQEIAKMTFPKAQHYLNEGETIVFGSVSLKVIQTPGHTPGGVCFYCEKEKVLFSGDTLFYNSVGRTDLAGGDTALLIQNIKTKIFTLPNDTIVYPGHGPKTTIGFEKEYNPYVII